jgi:predicted metal-dependent enzyme (double-stranded beta helix superfamily)
MTTMAPLRHFVSAMTLLCRETREESVLIERTRQHLAELIQTDDWLAPEFQRTHPDFYQQYLLYCDPDQNFSVQSFVWGPGQSTPIHNHTVWGVVGVLKGAERCQRYRIGDDGTITKDGDVLVLNRGDIDVVSPSVGDLHTVANAFADQVSVSIHVYGANIGTTPRSVFVEGSKAVKPFVSGYSSQLMPNIWGREV